MTVMSQDAMMITDEVKVSSQAGALQGCLANLSGPGPTWGTPALHLAITGGDQWLPCQPALLIPHESGQMKSHSDTESRKQTE